MVLAARRASGGCCRPQQPSNTLRLKGFQQPLAAAAGQLKERQSPKIRPASGAPLWVRCSGLKTSDRTTVFRTHRPSGRERSEAASSQAPYRSQRPKRRRSLIPLLVLFPREPLRLRSRGNPVAANGPPHQNPKQKHFFSTGHGGFSLGQRKVGAALRGARHHIPLRRNGGISAAMRRCHAVRIPTCIRIPTRWRCKRDFAHCPRSSAADGGYSHPRSSARRNSHGPRPYPISPPGTGPCPGFP